MRQGLTALLVVLAAAAVLLAALALGKVADQQRAVCLKVYSQIEQTLERGKKGLPANAYYKQHPGELRKAMRQTDRALRDFQPSNC